MTKDEHNKAQRFSHANHTKFYSDIIRKKHHPETHEQNKKPSFIQRLRRLLTCSKPRESELTNERKKDEMSDDLLSSSSNT